MNNPVSPLGMRLLLFVAGMFVSMLPPRYRRWWPLEDDLGFVRATAVSGLLQIALFIFLVLVNVLDRFQREAIEIEMAALNRPDSRLLLPREGIGVFAFANTVFQPANMLMFYMMIEGIIRTFGAWIGGQVLATLPLTAVALIHTKIEVLPEKRRIGPPIIDEVERVEGKDYDLQILSCRPKADWNKHITVEFEELFYQVIREERREDARPYVYYLRKNPVGRLVVVRNYKIDDVLKPPPPKVYPGERNVN